MLNPQDENTQKALQFRVPIHEFFLSAIGLTILPVLCVNLILAGDPLAFRSDAVTTALGVALVMSVLGHFITACSVDNNGIRTVDSYFRHLEIPWASIANARKGRFLFLGYWKIGREDGRVGFVPMTVSKARGFRLLVEANTTPNQPVRALVANSDVRSDIVG